MRTTSNSMRFGHGLALSVAAMLAVPAPLLAWSGNATEVIVRVAPGESIAALGSRHGVTVRESMADRGIALLTAHGPSPHAATVARLRADSHVLWAEVNREHFAPEGATQSFFFNVAPAAYDQQYMGETLGLGDAHDGATGQGVIVAVLDTGVDPNHPLLAGRVAPGVNFIDPNAAPNDAGNGLDDDGDGVVDEMAGHGTFIAGLILTVAPDATILPITVLNSDGVGTAYSVSKGIYHAISAGADVINLSLVSPYPSSMVAEAIAAAEAQGIVVVASVGNTDKERPVYPAAYGSVVAVCATDAADSRASFSDYGSYVDLAAPGVQVVSSWQGEYASSSGASFSAAIVSGAAALIRSVEPSLPPAGVLGVLAATSMPIDSLNPGYEGLLGAGRIQPDLAVLSLDGSVPASGPCDVDANGAANSADIAAFVALWSIQDPAADIDGNSVIDGADIEAFLQAWLECVGA